MDLKEIVEKVKLAVEHEEDLVVKEFDSLEEAARKKIVSAKKAIADAAEALDKVVEKDEHELNEWTEDYLADAIKVLEKEEVTLKSKLSSSAAPPVEEQPQAAPEAAPDPVQNTGTPSV